MPERTHISSIPDHETGIRLQVIQVAAAARIADKKGLSQVDASLTSDQRYVIDAVAREIGGDDPAKRSEITKALLVAQSITSTVIDTAQQSIEAFKSAFPET